MEMVKDKIERWKLLAELFLNKNIKAYIKEINGDLHFCDILFVGEDSVRIYNYGPAQRAGTKDTLYWINIEDFDEDKNEVKNGQSN